MNQSASKGSISRRVTPKGTHPERTAQPHVESERHVKHSPSWFGWLIGGLLGFGAFIIVGNYLDWLPGGASNVWLGVGLVIVLGGLLASTRWR